ncbi:MAG: hypothetical protein GC182_08635 [Rhodopseudomonas sp.]|nr:hypothetical protein [Rhodopseudomonas sp.]
MTYPRLKPCPKCGVDAVDIWTYESGWSRTECSSCDWISSCEGRKLDAIRKHNQAFATSELQLTDDAGADFIARRCERMQAAGE